MYDIVYDSKAFKFLKKADTKLRNSLQDKIKALSINPYSNQLDVKKLKGRDGYRLRVGQYRVLYHIDNDVIKIYIIDIAHRKEVYQ